MKQLTTINPYLEKNIKTYHYDDISKVDKRLMILHKSQKNWANTSLESRATLILKLSSALRENVHFLAKLMTDEMGKPITQSRAEVYKCADACEFFAKQSPALVHNILQASGAPKNIHLSPIGVVFIIMPWNFPLWQVIRATVPALLMGNTIILKHSPNTTGCALAFEKLLSKIHPHLLKFTIADNTLASKIIAHPIVQAVSLTGSTKAGRSVASLSGQHIKKSVLELGGSDPYIVFPDADIQKAAQLCAQSRLINSGQSCIAAKRFLLHKEIYSEFKQHLIEAFEKQRTGNPRLEETTIGPLARKDLAKNLRLQVSKSLRQGAKLAYEQELQMEKGYFYPMQILEKVKPGNIAFEEELFGPVAALASFKTDDEALRLANLSIYGLGAALYTNNTKRIERFQQELETGSIFINDFVKSQSHLPFGGIKASGYGRELGLFGLMEFTNIKTVVRS